MNRYRTSLGILVVAGTLPWVVSAASAASAVPAASAASVVEVAGLGQAVRVLVAWLII